MNEIKVKKLYKKIATKFIYSVEKLNRENGKESLKMKFYFSNILKLLEKIRVLQKEYDNVDSNEVFNWNLISHLYCELKDNKVNDFMSFYKNYEYELFHFVRG